MDWKKIMSKKQRKGKNREIQEKKAYLLDCLQDLPMEMNLRLFCETMPEELICGQVLWVEKIIVTGADFDTGSKKKLFRHFWFFLNKILMRKKG